ncbi:uncharacterized protein K02A2.6-like [Uranotaenia lowii]|uniref:uncharacterized protein K02A2.6-like n=1 Tax=Uranotaenia lowii TaxID=190385 RepID=UPI002479F0E7|nr:uncharacterized protein K02A2.6-like [Uranotaenia lowii]
MIDKTAVEFLIDSGASINTVTEEAWDVIQQRNTKVFNYRTKCDRQFNGYASQEPLQVKAMFEAWLSINPVKPKCYAEFFVIEGAQRSLLSKSTAEELKVLKVGLHVSNIDGLVKPFPKFPGILVKLSIDDRIIPKKVAYLRVPAAMEQKVNDKLEELLLSDVIERVVGSPEWISPMVVVPKGKDDVRICINMKNANEAVQREHYPLPVIDTFLNKLKGSKFYSRLDITSAYHHVELHPDSRSITTFMTGKGLMRFKRLMFGINAAPEIFQRIMTEMLMGIEGVIIYIDDIVVFGRTREEHDARLEEVLRVLKDNNALLNKEKCVIGVQEMEILGFKVSTTGISPSEEKVSAIKNFRLPSSKEEVRSFLGLVNFVGQFIPDLSTRSEPLRMFVRGEIDKFGDNQQKAFDDLRNELVNNVRKLGFFDPCDTTELYVDASPVGLGAVLIQKDDKGVSRIISFASKGLTPAERVYPQTQREALATIGHWNIFMKASTKTEDEPVQGLKVLHFVYNLIIFVFDIFQCDAAFDEGSDHFLFALNEGLSAITLKEIQKETEADQVLMAVINALKTDKWEKELFRYQAFQNELGSIDGIVVRNDRIVLPKKLRSRALQIAHKGHPGIVAMRRNLREKLWWPCMDRDVNETVQQCAGCSAVSRQNPPEPMIRTEMPERAWQQIGIDFFSAKECATFLVTVDYYSRFLSVSEMKITNAAKTIEVLEALFREHTYPETIRCDNGPPFSSVEFSEYCTSRNIRLVHTIPYWPQMNGLVEMQNQGILRALRIAKVTQTDWRKALQDYVYMVNTTPHSTTDKAPFELLTGRPVKDLLPSLRTDPNWMRDESTREKDAIRKVKGKIYADERRKAKTSEIEVGDKVMIRNYEAGKLEPKFRLEKYTVIEKTGSDTLVANEDGTTYRRPISHLRKFPLQKTTEDVTERMTQEDVIVSSDNSESDSPVKMNLGNKRKHQEVDNNDGVDSKELPPNRPTRPKKLPSRYMD